MVLIVARATREGSGYDTAPRVQFVPNASITPVSPAGPPVAVEVAGAAAADPGNGRWEEVDLPRRRNVLEWVGRSVQRQKFTAAFSGEVQGDEQAGVQSWINQLYELAMPSSGGEPPIVTVSGPLYGNFAGYLWRVEVLSPNDDARRRDSDGEVCHQSIEVTLARHYDIGVITAANVSPAAAAAERQGAEPTTPAKTYTVVKGDTLGRIAATQLGSASRWQEIAKLNDLRDPNTIRPGQILKLP